MLTPVADGILVHRSELLRNLTVVVHGRAGALVADLGTTAELARLAGHLSRQAGRTPYPTSGGLEARHDEPAPHAHGR